MAGFPADQMRRLGTSGSCPPQWSQRSSWRSGGSRTGKSHMIRFNFGDAATDPKKLHRPWITYGLGPVEVFATELGRRLWSSGLCWVLVCAREGEDVRPQWSCITYPSRDSRPYIFCRNPPELARPLVLFTSGSATARAGQQIPRRPARHANRSTKGGHGGRSQRMMPYPFAASSTAMPRIVASPLRLLSDTMTATRVERPLRSPCRGCRRCVAMCRHVSSPREAS
jgi:hypothetical protein